MWGQPPYRLVVQYFFTSSQSERLIMLMKIQINSRKVPVQLGDLDIVFPELTVVRLRSSRDKSSGDSSLSALPTGHVDCSRTSIATYASLKSSHEVQKFACQVSVVSVACLLTP